MYVIQTSDGGVHTTPSSEVAAAVLDRYGPEVVSYETITPEPSKPQIEAFIGAIQLYAPTKAKLVGAMDEDGTMIMQVTEDEFIQSSRWCRDGRMLGTWF